MTTFLKKLSPGRIIALGFLFCILLGSLLEACWMFCPGFGLEPAAWGTWLPLVLLLVAMGLVCCFSFLGALSVRRVFPESR